MECTCIDCACVRQTDLPHTSRLFADYLYHPDRLRPFYAHPEHDLGSVEAAAREVAMPEGRRAAIVDALRPRNPDSANLDLLARPGTVAVVTGQQVGLFSGPAYTVYKALTAVKLARELTARGTVAVPVFWLATEDHDFAEVNHCWVFDAAQRAVKIQVRRAPASGQPVGRAVLPSPPVDELRDALAGLPFADEVLGVVQESYTPGRSMGEAFSALLKRALADFDLIHLDPMDPALRQLAAPVLRAAVEAAPDLNAALLERNRVLTEAGYHAQVHVEEQTSLVFLLENGRRLALRRHNDSYVQNGRRFTSAELASRAETLSPNALLRPVVQDFMLPTAAYVGGPAELAYLAQSEVIYRRLLGRMPVAMPRSGFTLLDSHSRKLMSRYRLCLPDFYPGEEAVRQHIAAALVPPSLSGTLAATRATIESTLGSLGAELERFDPTLAVATNRSRAKMLFQLEKCARKIGREMLRRDERASADAARLYGLIYPERHLQERLYSIVPMLARFGGDLADRLYDAIRLDCPDHQVATL